MNALQMVVKRNISSHVKTAKKQKKREKEKKRDELAETDNNLLWQH